MYLDTLFITIIRNYFFPFAVFHAAIHACRIKAEIVIALCINSYQAAFATHFHKLVFYNFIASLLQGHAFIFHQARYVMCYYRTQKILTMTSAGYSTCGIVGVSAGTYYRTIANAAIAFVGHATGRCSRRKIALRIASCCSYSSILVVRISFR